MQFDTEKYFYTEPEDLLQTALVDSLAYDPLGLYTTESWWFVFNSLSSAEAREEGFVIVMQGPPDSQKLEEEGKVY